MATVKGGNVFPLLMDQLDLAVLREATLVAATPTVLMYRLGGFSDELVGSFAFDAVGMPVSGLVTAWHERLDGGVVFSATGLSVDLGRLLDWIQRGATSDALSVAFANGVEILGGQLSDRLFGFGGNDEFVGGGGLDFIDGGAGRNTVRYSGAYADYVLLAAAGGWSIADNRALAPDGVQRIEDIQLLRFADRTVDLTLRDPTLGTIGLRLTREEASDSARQVSTAVANGLLSASAGLMSLVDAVDATSSVATLSYQFFTGAVPSAAGMDFLVSPRGENVNNLNSAYYQSFTMENRYINFSVSLATLGEGRARFESDYGNLTLFEATRTAYATIFGDAPSDLKVDLLLNAVLIVGGASVTRAQYLATLGGTGELESLGAKAAVAGWLLAEAAKADLGVYALANEAFLTDVALRDASFSVDIIAGYAQPGFIFDGG